MNTAAIRESNYALGHSKHELERLARQAQAFEPFTRQLFQEAGIRPGMHILDVGCGAGDVAFLAAELVGPTGEVLGVDHAEAAVENANTRVREREIRTARFLHGDPAIMRFEQPFDAVVGRLVLMYYQDPVDALRKIMRHVRSGGLIIFQEFDMGNVRSMPDARLYNRAVCWMKTALSAVGTRIDMGLELLPTFLAAGLPEPSLRIDAVIGGAEFPYEILAATIESLLPTMVDLNIATAKEVEPTTLARRMRDEVVAISGVVVAPALVGAWCHRA